ncbi:MAG TPA: hypothetical protein VJG32_13165 [Anaerolineae bacterium]|nr:hypothetical protein [Anaerolineae bacterium]
MDPQLTNLIVAVGIGLVALLIIRFVFRIIHLGFNLILLGVVAVVAYLLLRGG